MVAQSMSPVLPLIILCVAANTTIGRVVSGPMPLFQARVLKSWFTNDLTKAADRLDYRVNVYGLTFQSLYLDPFKWIVHFQQ